MPRLIPSLIRASLGSSRVALSAVLLARASLRGAAPIAHAEHAQGRAHGVLFVPCGKLFNRYFTSQAKNVASLGRVL